MIHHNATRRMLAAVSLCALLTTGVVHAGPSRQPQSPTPDNSPDSHLQIDVEDFDRWLAKENSRNKPWLGMGMDEEEYKHWLAMQERSKSFSLRTFMQDNPTLREAYQAFETWLAAIFGTLFFIGYLLYQFTPVWLPAAVVLYVLVRMVTKAWEREAREKRAAHAALLEAIQALRSVPPYDVTPQAPPRDVTPRDSRAREAILRAYRRQQYPLGAGLVTIVLLVSLPHPYGVVVCLGLSVVLATLGRLSSTPPVQRPRRPPGPSWAHYAAYKATQDQSCDQRENIAAIAHAHEASSSPERCG